MVNDFHRYRALAANVLMLRAHKELLYAYFTTGFTGDFLKRFVFCFLQKKIFSTGKNCRGVNNALKPCIAKLISE